MGFGSFLKSSLKEQLGSWDDFSDGFKEGFFGNDYFRDYKHGSKTFVADGHALAPTNKFLFHVYFTLNTAEIPSLSRAMGGAEGASRIGMLVKSITCFVNSVLGVDTPKFSKTTRNLYFNLGINKPWLEPDWSVANGVVILVNDDTDIFYSLNCTYCYLC